MSDFLDGLWSLMKFLMKATLVVSAIVIVWNFIDYIGSFANFLDWLKDESGVNKVGPSLLILTICGWIIARFLFGVTGLIDADYSGILDFSLRNVLAPLIVSLILWAITGDTSITFISVPIVGVISLSLGL